MTHDDDDDEAAPRAHEGPEGRPPAACARVRGRLLELLDDALDALAAARDEGHLEACPSCAAERVRWERVLAAAAGTRPSDLAYAVEGLDRRLAAARSPQRVTRLELVRRAARGLAAAAAVAALFLGLRWAAGRAPNVDELFRSAGVEVGRRMPSGAGWIPSLDGLLPAAGRSEPR